MNKKEKLLDKIIDIVVKCTSYEVNNAPTITKSDILGKCRAENVVLARSILVLQLLSEGFTATTIAALLNRSVQAIHKLEQKAYDSIRTSRVCREAAAEVVLEIKKLYEN